MKKTFLPALLLAPVALLAFTPVRAQTEPNSSALMKEGNPPPPGERQGPMAQLSETERAQVKAAHDKAIEQDPALQQKMKGARDAMEAARKEMNNAMIQADPSVEPILAKITPPKRDWKQEGGAKQGGKEASRPWKHDGSGGKGMANLSEAERQQVKALHEQVKNDPAVAAARDAMKSAATPEARQAAEKALHQASREAMLKTDPSIEPILEKLHPKAAEQPNTTPAAQ